MPIADNAAARFQDKVTLTTPSLRGIYRISWSAFVDQSNTNDSVEARLRNTTDDVSVGSKIVIEPKDVGNRYSVGAFAEIVFTGAAKTFKIQWRQQGGSTAAIQEARIEIWRVAS